MTNPHGSPTKNADVLANIQTGIRARLADQTTGRRSLHWLAERTGIPYSTLRQKIASRPGRLDSEDLVRIADAFDVEVWELAVAA